MINLNDYKNIKLLFIFLALTNCLLSNQIDRNSYQSINEPKYISIPFRENNPYYSKFPSKYSSYNFLNDYFINNLSIDLFIGTPHQEINAFINQEDSCFKFIEKSKNNNNNNINNNYYNKIKTYSPKKSLTFLLNKNNKAIMAEDLFLFKTGNNNNNTNEIHMPFNLDIYSGEIDEETEFNSEVGLNSQFLLDNKNCPNFIKELKKNKIIKEEIYSFVYRVKTQGNLFIGDNLYNINNDKYNKNNFFSVNAIQNKNGIKWNINFDKIYIYDIYLAGNSTISNRKNGGKIYLPYNTVVNLKVDQKLIIGTLEYKKMIDDLYFNNLIQLDICKVDLVNYKSKNYYVYSCSAFKFATFEYPEDDYYVEQIFHYEHFPGLIFYSNNLNYSFELGHEDLFEIKGDRFYFLIVFESDPPNKNTQEWVIGEHFIKKHIFSYNIKTKKIWFYNEKNFNQNFKENDDDEDDETKEKEKERIILKKENNKNLFIVLLIIFAIFFSIFSFYLGIKIKERRKKKANELIDEYEYFSERETKNKSINNINNDKSNNRKIKYEIELNSKI